MIKSVIVYKVFKIKARAVFKNRLWKMVLSSYAYIKNISQIRNLTFRKSFLTEMPNNRIIFPNKGFDFNPTYLMKNQKLALLMI